MTRPALRTAAVAAALATCLSLTPTHGARAAAGECGLPATTPIWIDYGEASVKPDTRAVLAKPGVVVASSGTAVPAAFRSAGAATTYFELNLDRIVGTPSAPAGPEGVPAAADALYDRAVKSTACQTPWITLNELSGSNLPTPWSATNTTYRANVLAVVQQLARRGAHPALLVQGNPTVAGDAGAWWKAAAGSGQLVYEAYYDASKIYPLGPLIAARRMRLGMRLTAATFESAGVPPARLGFMLGFHSAQTPGIAGRQGLQPTLAWLRVVKWEALAAQQVALDEHIPFLASWGWGTFGPDSVDADKPLAACTWLWARDPALCDAPATATAAVGPGFDTSRLEGPIVLPPGVLCTLGDGRRVTAASVARLARLTQDSHAALTAQFARAALENLAPVARRTVLAAEQDVIARVFHGSRPAYVRALARRHADPELARGVLADALRRTAIAKLAGPGGTVFDWIARRESAAADHAICLRDELPGQGRPLSVSNARDVGTVPLPSLLPFLLRDTTAPATPAAPSAARSGSTVTVTWASGREADLAGYDVFRTAAGSAPMKLTTLGPSGTATLYDVGAPAGATYTLQAVDTSGNRSALSPPSNAP